MKIKNIIATGVTGVLGYALLSYCVDNKIKATVIVRKSSNRIGNIPKSPLIKVAFCDLMNLKELSTIIDGKFDAFFHFGWDGTFGDSRLSESRQMKNVEITQEAVIQAHKLGCKVFIGSGSQSEFGHYDIPLNSNLTCKPDNWYGKAKLLASSEAQKLCTGFGIDFHWCRVVSVFGPNDGPQTLIMSVINKLLNNEDLLLTKCDQIWNYTYSYDIARLFFLVAEKGVQPIYVFGNKESHPLKDYVLEICKKISPTACPQFGAIPYFKNQVTCLKVDTSELEKDLSYTPRFTFSEGIEETINWAKKQQTNKNSIIHSN